MGGRKEVISGTIRKTPLRETSLREMEKERRKSHDQRKGTKRGGPEAKPRDIHECPGRAGLEGHGACNEGR